jgi:hypothetical protein
MKSLRKITSLTSLISFLMIIATFLVLYIVPQGRIANWADWRLMGLSKVQWTSIHINMGTLFLIAILFHIYFNWTPIVNYLKNRKKELTFMNKEFGISMIICVIFSLGTYLELPPFSSYLGVSESIKEQAAKEYGNPPYGHAELSSLKSFTKKVNIDLDKSMVLLNENGIRFENDKETLLSIAAKNNVSPQAIYNTILPAKVRSAKPGLPDDHPAGLGKLTLSDLCAKYNLNIQKVITGLKQTGLNVNKSIVLKDIAQTYNISPFEIYEKIQVIYKD